MQQEQKVPENVQRKATRDSKLRDQRAKERKERRDTQKFLVGCWLKKGEEFANEYAAFDKNQVD